MFLIFASSRLIFYLMVGFDKLASYFVLSPLFIISRFGNFTCIMKYNHCGMKKRN